MSDLVEILRGKFFFEQVLKVSVFYLEKEKNLIDKKNSGVVNIKTKKALFTDPIFSEGFGQSEEIFATLSRNTFSRLEIKLDKDSMHTY